MGGVSRAKYNVVIQASYESYATAPEVPPPTAAQNSETLREPMALPRAPEASELRDYDQPERSLTGGADLNTIGLSRRQAYTAAGWVSRVDYNVVLRASYEFLAPL